MLKFEFTCEGDEAHQVHGTVEATSWEEAEKYIHRNYRGFHITKLCAVHGTTTKKFLEKVSDFLLDSPKNPSDKKSKEVEIDERDNKPDLFI